MLLSVTRFEDLRRSTLSLMPKDEDFDFQRGPRPEQPDQGAPDQSAKIAHQLGLSTDSRAPVSCLGFAVDRTQKQPVSH
jgi:hypothetical protein